MQLRSLLVVALLGALLAALALLAAAAAVDEKLRSTRGWASWDVY